MRAEKIRLLSLDAFRGLAVAAMIFVNCPGTYDALYSPLGHAEWNGWTFADTVFPTFLFIVGVSVVFSLTARKESGTGGCGLRIARRTLILFGLGLFLNTFPYFYLSIIRIPGVLQRIALCYLFASLIVLHTGIRGRTLWLIGLLAAYWLMLRFFPVPGIGPGMLEPGRNFTSYVDSLFLKGHMWTHYETWDPEGLMSTIPAIASTLFGALTADWLHTRHTPGIKAAGMALAGILLLAAGEMLDQWMPINKNIWTSTYSISMAGLALLCMAFCYWAIDVAGWKRWARPFEMFGKNAIAVYVLSILIDTMLTHAQLSRPDGSNVSLRSFLFDTCFMPLASPKTASLLFASAYVVLMLLPGWLMWRKRLFLKA